MSRINPKILRQSREKRGWSQHDLSRQSGIDKGTIYRIEIGKASRNRSNVIDRLSMALKIEPELLTSMETPPETDPIEHILPKTQLTARISAETANALALVMLRYSVRRADIIELAPLLFHLVASESLAERAAKLGTLRATRGAIEAMNCQFAHLTERLLSDWNGEEIEEREALSIAALDLRGSLIDTEHVATRRRDYDEEEHNPFIAHIRARIAAVRSAGSRDLVEGWGATFGPRYAICHAEALAFFDGDEEAADDLIEGRYPISDMPADLRTSNRPGERAAWAREKRIELAARADAFLASIGMDVAL